MGTLTYGSLFTGVGGFDLGFDRAGLHCLWQVEIDAAARSVLSRHWPDVPKFADVRDVGAQNLEPVDVITFGSPCQDLSVAGKRAGMSGARSGLFYEAVRIIREIRPAIALWENVPGALSSHQGRDFGAAIDALADAGAVDICWRVLDAQWFGVAQRRRRVFLVADFRGERAAQILFEPEGVSGHPQARRAAGQDIAGTLGGSSQSGGFRTTDLDNNGAYIPLSARSLTTREGMRHDATTETYVLQHAQIGRKYEAGPQSKGWQQDIAFTLDSRSAADVVAYQCQGTNVGEMGTLRRGNGNVTGGVPFVGTFQNTGHGWWNQSDTATTIRTPEGGGSLEANIVAHALTAEGHDASEDGTGRGTPLVPTIDIALNITNGGGKPGQGYPAVMAAMAVRRLTPVECERLQGFPDNWTAGQADSSRYRQLGNAVAVPCAEWIAKRIVEALR